MSPAVAIITRTKDRPLLLRRAFESVVNQTFEDWLLVLVNDGGDPGPVDALVEEYSEALKGRIQLIHHETSVGMEGASNAGIQASDSTYVTIHDDDDAWHPEFLATTVGTIENNTLIPNLGGVVTTVMHIEETIEDDVITEVTRYRCDAWIQEMTLWNVSAGNFFPPIAFLYKRAAYEEMQRMYSDTLPVLGDWDFNLAFFQKFEATHVDEPYAYYYTRLPGRHDIYSNTTTDGNHKHDVFRTFLKNEALRDDLRKGQLGKGLLLNLAPSQKRLEDAAERQEYAIKSVQDLQLEIKGQVVHLPTHTEQLRILDEHMNVLHEQIAMLNKRLDHTDQHIYAIYKGLKLLGAPVRLVKKVARKLRA